MFAPFLIIIIFFSHSQLCPHVYGKTTAWIFVNNGSYERSPPGVVPFVLFICLIGLIFNC